jgi:hypothetical protein
MVQSVRTHTPQYDAGFIAACHDKKTGGLRFVDTLRFGFPLRYFNRYPVSVWNNTHWFEEYTDGATTTTIQTLRYLFL